MNTCGTCKFRGDPVQGADYKPSTYFLCARIKEGGRLWYDSSPGKGAFVEDGSGLYAALCVESDFGCNRWEAK